MDLLITDSSVLDDAAGFVHDAQFDEDDVSFDPQTRHFFMSLWQPDSALGHYRKIRWVFYRRTIPVRRWELSFENVDECEWKWTSRLNKGVPLALATLRYELGTLWVLTHYCLTLELRVSKLWGVLRQTDDISEERALRPLAIRLREPPAWNP